MKGHLFYVLFFMSASLLQNKNIVGILSIIDFDSLFLVDYSDTIYR